MPPIFSTVTVFTELLVTTGVLYAFRSGFVRGRFPARLVAGLLAYETLVNVVYMLTRTASHGSASGDSPFEIGLAIFHGTFSLVMFVGLIAFMAIAWRAYGRGVNYFRLHRRFTVTFIVLWLVSVLSGLAFYALEYFVR